MNTFWETSARLRLVGCLALFAGLAGCGETKPPVAKPPPPPQEAAPPETPKLKEETPPSQPPVAEEKRPDPRERFLLLASSGPVLVELSLRIDDRPHREVWEALIDEVLRLADSDGDGVPTWKEVGESPEFRDGRYGNAPINSPEEQQNMVRLYDTRTNGLMDRSEAPRFITRNVGGARAFSLRGANYHRHQNRLLSPLRRLLDADRDGSLSAAELAVASERLRSYDLDDDEILTAGDFAPAADAASERRMLMRRSEPETAFLLHSRTDWGLLLDSLQQFYALGGDLEKKRFVELAEWDRAPAPEWFDRMDDNSDGVLQREELAGWENEPPHVALQVSFGQPQDRPRLEVLNTAETWTAEVFVFPERISLRLPYERIDFYWRDQADSADLQQMATTQLAALDSDDNGYLEPEEIPEEEFLGVSFETIDTDADGKIYPAELVERLRRRQAPLYAQVRGRASYPEDALLMALDQNYSGQLETREIAEAAELLARMDRDGDGQIAADEIPQAIRVGIVRGDPQQGDALYRPPTGLQPAENAPPWFVGMDRNGDGEISPAEFLGTAEQFHKLDQDEDGFVEVSEAE